MKKLLSVLLALCLSLSCFCVSVFADNDIIAQNTAKYYSYLYDLILKYENNEIGLDTLLGDAYNEYMNTGVDNIGQAFTNIADIVKSLTPFSDDKWNDWYRDNKMGGGGGGGNRDDSVLNGYGAVCVHYDSNGNLYKTVYAAYGVINRQAGNQIVGYSLGDVTCKSVYFDNTVYVKDVVVCGYLNDENGNNYILYGDWRYDNGDDATDNITELPEKEIPSYDDNSVPEDDLIDFLEDLLNDLQLQFPDLSTIEGLLRAILAKLGTLDSDNDNELLEHILVAIQALKNNGETADNSELLKTLEDLKNALVFKDDEKTASLAEILNTLVQNQVRRSDITIDPSLYNQRYALIEAKLLGKFSFISEIKNFVQYAIDSYSNTENSPTVTIDLFNHQHTIDFSAFDDSINLIRWIVAAFVYLSYAFATFRKIPGYINGGDNQ